MYSPNKPSVYRQVRYQHYCAERRRQEAAAKESASATGANFLANALFSSMSTSASPPPPPPQGPAALMMSAEELHQMRVRRSAAMGVKRAVEMEKESIVVEHKKQRLEGSDTRSKISSLLGKLSAEAKKTDTASPPSVVAPSDAQPQTSNVEVGSAPLVFASSGMAAGGFVLKAADTSMAGHAPSSSSPTSGPKLSGLPSSAVLIRFSERPAHFPQGPLCNLPAATVESVVVPLTEMIRAECAKMSTVRGAKYFLWSKEISASGATTSTSTWSVEEELRLFVRLDSIADAFKAAEVLALLPMRWLISFYPEQLYDEDTLVPQVGEVPAKTS